MFPQMTKPVWPAWKKNTILRLLAPLEYWSRWFFFLFGVSALVRLTIEILGAMVVLAAVVGLLWEFEQRKIDRGIRVATLFTQIAQTHALSNDRGLTALKASVEALGREGVSMQGINLAQVDLRQASLNGVDFRSANLNKTDFSGATLDRATFDFAAMKGARLKSAILREAAFVCGDLSNADFFSANLAHANLKYANLSATNLMWADFHRTDLSDSDVSGASFRYARNLTQSQLDKACANPKEPPIDLPDKLKWTTKECETITHYIDGGVCYHLSLRRLVE